jgi:hypothetical protein
MIIFHFLLTHTMLKCNLYVLLYSSAIEKIVKGFIKVKDFPGNLLWDPSSLLRDERLVNSCNQEM